MPRIPRLVVEGGYYHILTRGNDRKNLFRYQQDYRVFVKILKKYLAKFDIKIINWCLMPNHIHLLIRINEAGHLAKFMQAVLQVYAGYFKNKYNSVGFVFQNRYKSLHIKHDGYLLDCARYIERNPLRARITENLFSYPWSSLRVYARGISDGIVSVFNPMYLQLAASDEERRRIYCNRVVEERPYEHIVDQAFRIQ